MKKVLLLLFLLLSLANLYAQNGRITGFVYDSNTGDPLVGANAYIENTAYGAATDLNGKFTILNIPAGYYVLKIKYMGYQENASNIILQEGESLEKVIELVFQVVEGQAVQITAQADGQMQAINQQLSSQTISNIVSQARIQEVPDANAAESVGRLPGVSLKRSSGEGNEVVIRGLQPRLNVITVNNIRMPSTNEYNSAVGLAGISQYMLDGIEVRKSLTAQDDADVVGGIVDLKLATAPSGFHMNAIMDGMYNGLTENFGSYRGSVQGSNRFFGDKLGIIGQVNIEQADRTNHALSAGYNMDTRVSDNEGVFLTNGNFQMDEIIRDRFGVNVLIDYKLPRGKIQVNSIYNQFDEDRWERDYQFNVAAGAVGLDKMMISADEKSHSLVNGINLESEVFGIAQFDLGASFTSGNRERTNKALGFWYDASVTEPINPQFYQNTYGKIAYDIINHMQDENTNYQISRLFREEILFEENESTFQTNLKIPLAISKQLSGFVKFGGKMRFKDRKYDFDQDGDNGGIYGGDVDINEHMINRNPEIDWPWNWSSRPPSQTALPAYPLYAEDKDVILNNKVVLKDFSDRHWVEQIVDRGEASNWAGLSLWNVKAADLSNDYAGDEKMYAGYLMTEINWGKKITLNVGVRYEKEETKYNGYGVIDIASAQDILDTLDAVTRTNDYFLPSMNLRFNYASWGDVRFAYSKSLARPEYYAFVPHYETDNALSFTAAAGNPYLKPAVSQNFDLIFSFYNNYIGLFTLGGFYKEIDDFFYGMNVQVVDVEEDNNLHIYDNVIVPRGQYINIWLNLDKTSYIKGLEFDWQTNFWYLPSPLNGIVLGMNYTKITSQAYYYQSDKEKIKYGSKPWEFTEVRVDSFQTRRLIDQPDNIFNVSLGYDYKDFSMRFAYYFQGKTLSWKSNDNQTDGFNHDYSRLDFSMRQKLPIQGLSIQFLLSNITEEAEKAYTFQKKFNNSEQYYGMTGTFGIRYAF